MAQPSVGRSLPVPPRSVPDNRAGGGTGCLLRLLWMGIGNLVLVGAAALILQRGALSAYDVLYWATVVGLGVVRYLDVALYGGTTADNRPATMADFRRYLLILGAVAVAVWAACHLIGPRL